VSAPLESVMATEGASKSMSARSPQSEKNFQICRRSLLDAKELYADDLIDDEEYGAMKQAAQANYLKVKSEISMLVVDNLKKRRRLDASDCSESDEELCPRPKSARTKASTSAQKSQTNTQTSTRTRSEKGAQARSSSAQQRMSWSRGS